MATRKLVALALSVLVLSACRNDVAPPPPKERVPNPQSVSVLTQHNDNTRAGWNANETALTTSNVNVQKFGKLFTLSVDDQVYAQPLVVGHVQIGGGERNVVYVATVANTVYAFDADDGTPYWKKSYTQPAMRPPKASDLTGACGGTYQDFSGNIGIVGTPVIDAARGTMYFVARSMSGTSWVQYLHAVSILDGSEQGGGPKKITATVNGTGDGSVNGVITFEPQRQNQRQGLTLVGNTVYVSFASHCDWRPYHGWVLGYDASTLQQTAVYNATPDGYAGGMWESGMGMAADGAGNLYVVTGNGTVGVGSDPTSVRNRGESAIKLTPSGSTLSVTSWFTPFNYQALNDVDLDYGGMGALLIPGSHFYLTGGKDGKLYLLDTDGMGGWQSSSNAVQQVVALGASANMHCQAAYYRGSTKEYAYVWSENDWLRAIPFDRGTSKLDEFNQIVYPGSGPTGQSGAVLSLSSNGSTDGTGILWASYASSGDAEHTVSPGILRAFDANNVRQELWNNQQNPSRDGAGTYAKFNSPTIANGHVYLPTFSNRVVVYGLFQP
ncbi:MAG TPA: PQQ-binding-like beta-propeller repeat protein [Gemmatimonadaceae bacterium]|nr:PQQ-binding-like beta-propeller repeat protein [Gemmatimonadaceae bacterium]